MHYTFTFMKINMRKDAKEEKVIPTSGKLDFLHSWADVTWEGWM